MGDFQEAPGVPEVQGVPGGLLGLLRRPDLLTCRAGDAGIPFIALCSRRPWRPWRPCRPPKPITAAQAERHHQNREQQYFWHNPVLLFPRLRRLMVAVKF